MGTGNEAVVKIGGHTLTEGQTMALRMAVESKRTELASKAYRQKLGPIADAYQRRLDEIGLLLLGES